MERAILELLTSHSSIALAVTDRGGVVALTTPAYARIVGRSIEGLGDETLAATLSAYDATGHRLLSPGEMPLVRARLGETVVDQIFTLKRHDGKLTYLRSNAVPLREANGDIRGAVTLVQDVTPEWSATLKQAELRNRLLTTVNHELRTPMTIIMGHAELLVDAMSAGEVPEPLQQSVSAIARAGDQLAGLASTITYLADLEGATHLHREPCDLVALVRGLGESHQAAAVAAGLTLRTDLGAPLWAELDVKLVSRAVAELLDNAIGLAPPKSEIQLQAAAWDGVVEVHVADHGPGISADERDRLVQPFERGVGTDLSASSKGLGLAVANAVASAHGGSLILADNDPSGLLVRLCLSRHETPSEANV